MIVFERLLINVLSPITGHFDACDAEQIAETYHAAYQTSLLTWCLPLPQVANVRPGARPKAITLALRVAPVGCTAAGSATYRAAAPSRAAGWRPMAWELPGSAARPT